MNNVVRFQLGDKEYPGPQSLFEDMKNGDKARVYIWTVEMRDDYYYWNGRAFKSYWSCMGAIDGEWFGKVKPRLGL